MHAQTKCIILKIFPCLAIHTAQLRTLKLYDPFKTAIRAKRLSHRLKSTNSRSVRIVTGGKFKATPIYVLPISVSLVVSILCTLLVVESKMEVESILILPETGYGPLLNGVIFVLAMGLAASSIYLLLKFGVHRFVRVLMGLAISVLTFTLMIFYSELLNLAFSLGLPILVILVLGILATAFVIFQVVFRRGKLSKITILVFGGATGSLLGAYIPLMSAVFILLLLAVYDVIAVFKGPVGKIAEKGLEHLPGASFGFKDIHIGLGDVTFYSMLASRVFLSYGWISYMSAAFGVLVGSYLSFKMVEKKGMFPGLPFPIILGLLASFTVSVFT